MQTSKRNSFRALCQIAALAFFAAFAGRAGAQVGERPYRTEFTPKAIEFWSDGTKLSGDLWFPSGMDQDETRPVIVLCNGWGGTKRFANPTAKAFAEAGYIALAFDYRGWGDSDSRLVLKQTAPELDENNEATVKAQFIRELVSPFDELEDIRAAIDYLCGERGVDAERIGIWGTSFGGGLVIWTAAHDSRIKCVVAQVGSMDQRTPFELGMKRDTGKDFGAEVMKLRIARARGEIAPVPQGEVKIGNLKGSPQLEEFYDYVPADYTGKITAPVIIIDAENEELFDLKNHGERVYNQLKGQVPVERHVIPGIKHYGIYNEAKEQATDLAIGWYDKHLKKSE